MADGTLSQSYLQTLTLIKDRVYKAQYRALKAVNRELIQLYWDIGKVIVERQEQEGWGKSVVEQLAQDLQIEFPGIKGFSTQNIWRMRKFFLEYRNDENLAQAVREIGWGHNIVIFEQVKDKEARHFYLTYCAQYGWSRGFLIDKIKRNEYERLQGNQTNFDSTVDEEHKTKAMLAVKDEYSFDFLTLPERLAEKELEQGLIENIIKFLAEMGGEFCFVGRQYRVAIDDQEYFVDLLFFHRKLKCLVAIDLKVGEFQFEYAGKMAGYLAVLDDRVKQEDENPSIGILICRTKNRTVVEYALNSVNKPMGVATFSYQELPEKIGKFLPSAEQIERRLLGSTE